VVVAVGVVLAVVAAAVVREARWREREGGGGEKNGKGAMGMMGIMGEAEAVKEDARVRKRWERKGRQRERETAAVA
jgi:hypothetical protein